MTKNWGDWFVEAIASLEDDLNYILELRRVRELWLQGELYLKSSDEQCLSLNERNILLGEVDFVSKPNDAVKMVADLKIGGRGYEPKILNGSGLPESLTSKTEFTLDDMDVYKKSEGSIFKDFCRLRDIKLDCQKYMILVIPKLVEPDRLGELLESAKFPGKEYSRKLQWFDIRVFHLNDGL